ncbi:tRNA (guanosine(37)-N1)-methyltransferase TrmD [uncultured Jatrophihabitans sp.]|uniref:tRNA (guanosine(37)-N1)-methyltransferase TrmD n=1 Tax=uncultured Jatrophihabitans sp. TaxID=1610747 RepID=UPI0035CB7B3D
MRIDAVTIFPDYLAPLRQSLLGKAIDRGQVSLGVHDLRHWTDDVHHTVDDTPYGGGPGMVMRAEPWGRALDDIAPADAPAQPRLVVPTPSGRAFTQDDAHRLAAEPWLLFACGRYEGIDSRVVEYAAERMPVEQVSLGDYVLSGGEAAVLVIVEATCRLLPGVLGNERSAVEDTFAPESGGLLEPPLYTRPASWRGRAVPDILLSGNHAAIERWRQERAHQRTAAVRPDLLREPGASAH